LKSEQILSKPNLKKYSFNEICDIFDGPHATPKKTDYGPIFLGISCLENGRLNLDEKEHQFQILILNHY